MSPLGGDLVPVVDGISSDSWGIQAWQGYQKTRSATPSPPSRTATRSEEHTSELQSLMRTSYAVFCLKKKAWTRKQNGRRQRRNPVTNSQLVCPHISTQ